MQAGGTVDRAACGEDTKDDVLAVGRPGSGEAGLSMRWRAAMDRALAPLGLTQAQYAVLAPLYGVSLDGARPSQREVADLTGLDPVYVSRLVRALEREGFLTRSTSSADPRAVELMLTERGKKTVEQGVKVVYELRERLTEPLGGNDGTRTAQLAKILRELLDTPDPGSLIRDGYAWPSSDR